MAQIFIYCAGLHIYNLGLVSIRKGHITAGRHNAHAFFVTRDPAGFWLTVGFVVLLGALCVYHGVKGKNDAARKKFA